MSGEEAAHVEGRRKIGASVSLALRSPGLASLPVSRGFLEGWDRQSLSERMEDEAGSAWGRGSYDDALGSWNKL